MGTIIQGFSPPIGFESDEPIRLRLMRAIAERLAVISVANGYHYDYDSITYKEAEDAEPKAPPQIYLFDRDEVSEEPMMGVSYKSVLITVEAFTSITDSLLVYSTGNFMLADIERAIHRDPLTAIIDPFFQDLADGLRYEQSEIISSFGDAFWAGNISQWRLSYHNVSGKPHLLQEEN